MPRTVATPLSELTDFLTSKGANAICDHLRAYWQERGFAIVAHAIRREGSENEYDVRSNLVNGLPPVVIRENLLRGTQTVLLR